MKEERILNVLGKVDEKYIKEADPEEKPCRKKPDWKQWTAIAACFCIIAAIGFRMFPPCGGMAVSAYACGTDEEITASGVVMNTGTISDTGEMTGHPLMFYLTGKDIETVRFSCKNQQINFMDWTEKRDEYGNAQNFTVAYGDDESEYYYLVIDWVPDTLIRELTDNPDSKIAALPEEMRQDMIVMEITFENGRKATKAITISLLDDGTFFAAFGDYKISENDDFIKRPDSAAISRDISYSQEDSLIREPAEDLPPEDVNLDAVKEIVQAYYSDTVFEVISIEVKSQGADEMVFSVCVSKGGVVQEPDRTIWLQLNDGEWEVTDEGY